VSEAVFPLAPVLLAALVARRGTLAATLTLAVAAAAAVMLQGHIIPSPLPNWQTWSLQDIGARAMISGTAAPSAWSGYVMPWLRGVSVLLLAATVVAMARWVFVRREREPASMVLIGLALLLFGMINALWLYNDRYYVVFVPALAILATRIGTMRDSVAGPLLALWAGVAVTGTRDMLGVNDTAGHIARQLEASGVHPWEIDAGYPWDGWRLYAHPEHLAPGGDPTTDVPFVTSDALTLYTIASTPMEGYDILEIVPLKDATWQATRQLYVLKQRPR
jgi:hypothetical protein